MNHSETLRSKLDLFRWFPSIILVNYDASWFIKDPLSSFKLFWNIRKIIQFRTIHNHFEQFWTIINHLEGFLAILKNPKQYSYAPNFPYPDEKITRCTIGVHGYNLLLNSLSLAVLWYNMLSNNRYLVSSFAISWYIVLSNAYLILSSFLMLFYVSSCWLA